MADLSPKTPAKVKMDGNGEDEESFKTCKTIMPTPRTRRQLRMTPARTSILSGGKPFKEAQSSGKKFNARSRRAGNMSNNQVAHKDDTAGSNETFIRCEQELMFDRDSLDAANTHKLSSTPNQLEANFSSIATNIEDITLEELDHKVTTRIRLSSTPKPQQRSPMKAVAVKSKSPIKSEPRSNRSKLPAFGKSRLVANPISKPSSRSPKKFVAPKNNNKMNTTTTNMPPPRMLPPRRQGSGGSDKEETRRQFVTPKMTYKKPASLMGTASRYLSQLNESRLTRARSFKSTAELEKDYFSSLRSF